MKKLAVLLLAALFALCAAGALADAYPCGGTITTNGVNLRYGPSTSTRIVDRLSSGESVTVLSESVPVADTWYYVRTAEGLHGYVHESLIRLSSRYTEQFSPYLQQPLSAEVYALAHQYTYRGTLRYSGGFYYLQLPVTAHFTGAGSQTLSADIIRFSSEDERRIAQLGLVDTDIEITGTACSSNGGIRFDTVASVAPAIASTTPEDFANRLPTSEAYKAIGVIETALYNNPAIYDAQLMVSTAEPAEYGSTACIDVLCYINGLPYGHINIISTPESIVLAGPELNNIAFAISPYWIYDWEGVYQLSSENLPFEQWILQIADSPTGESLFGDDGLRYEPIAEPEIYGLAIDKLSTRLGPGTDYEDAGTYSVKGQWLRVLSRAWSETNNLWWVKVEIPYRGETRTLWTGYKRFDSSTLSLQDLPVEFW